MKAAGEGEITHINRYMKIIVFFLGSYISHNAAEAQSILLVAPHLVAAHTFQTSCHGFITQLSVELPKPTLGEQRLSSNFTLHVTRKTLLQALFFVVSQDARRALSLVNRL